MTPELIGRREKLIAAWRAFAEGLTNLGYDPREVFETMTAVARDGLNESDQAAPQEAVREEGRVDVRLPPPTWDFDLTGRISEH